MTVEIKKCCNISGTVKAPPSKSMAHRLLICAALSEGKSLIHNISLSDDILATIGCLKALGAEIDLSEESDCTYTAYVSGISCVENNKINPHPMLDCKESGSTLRFLIPIALAVRGSAHFSGSRRLLERPLSIYHEIADTTGDFTILLDESGIDVSGNLKAGEYTVKGNISSQFISGLLFSLPLCGYDSTVTIIPPIESGSYIDLTLSALNSFGIKICSEKSDENQKRIFRIPGKQRYIKSEITVEGDYSNAAFFEAFNRLSGNVKITGLDKKSMQGDRVFYDLFDRLCNKNSLNEPISLADCPDLGPVLFALSAALYGGHFRDTKRLTTKESDRVSAMKSELEKFGCKVAVSENEVIIGNPEEKSPLNSPVETLRGHNDHRIVMSLSLLLSLTGGSIEGAEAVSKSFPDFFKRLESLGMEINYV